jgi:hypothetical protein
MTFTLTPAEFAAKVADLATQGIVLSGNYGSVSVPDHPELTILWSYRGEPNGYLTIQVQGSNFLERGIANDRIAEWMLPFKAA